MPFFFLFWELDLHLFYCYLVGGFTCFFYLRYGASWFDIWVWLWSLGFLFMKSLFAVMFCDSKVRWVEGGGGLFFAT